MTVLFAVSALAACGGSDAGAAASSDRQFTMGGASTSLVYQVPQYMETANLAEKQGLNLSFTTLGDTSAANVVAALLSKKFDFVGMSSVAAVSAAAEGAPIQVVAKFMESPTVILLNSSAAAALTVKPGDSPQARMQALKGMTIATNPEGTTANVLFKSILSGFGLEPQRDVHIIGVADPNAQATGLKEKQYDAIFAPVGYAEAVVTQGAAVLWMSSARGDFGDNLIQPSSLAVALKSTVADHPDTVKKLDASLAAAIDAIRTDPQTAGAALKQKWYAALDPDAFAMAWAQTSLAVPQSTTYTEADFKGDLELLRLTGKDKSGAVDYTTFVAAEARE